MEYYVLQEQHSDGVTIYVYTVEDTLGRFAYIKPICAVTYRNDNLGFYDSVDPEYITKTHPTYQKNGVSSYDEDGLAGAVEDLLHEAGLSREGIELILDDLAEVLDTYINWQTISIPNIDERFFEAYPSWN